MAHWCTLLQQVSNILFWATTASTRALLTGRLPICTVVSTPAVLNWLLPCRRNAVRGEHIGRAQVSLQLCFLSLKYPPLRAYVVLSCFLISTDSRPMSGNELHHATYMRLVILLFSAAYYFKFFTSYHRPIYSFRTNKNKINWNLLILQISFSLSVSVFILSLQNIPQAPKDTGQLLTPPQPYDYVSCSLCCTSWHRYISFFLFQLIEVSG